MRLLVTRPSPDGERTATELRARGHQVLLAPLLRIEAIADADIGSGPWAAILLTSANGARAIRKHKRCAELLALPVLAVGRASAEAARDASFSDVVSADGDAGDLARLAAARFAGTGQPLLHLAGEDRARDLAGDLGSRGVAVQTAVIYRAVTALRLPAEAETRLRAGAVDGVLHFSPRSADSYLSCTRDLMDRALAPVHFCISERAAAPLRRAGAADIRIADRPNEAALLALVGSRA
jgi:uroporphyrinogen-III synthase